MEFKEKLAQALKDNKMTATELAQRSGVNKSLISRYLTGERIPKYDKISSMAKALHVDERYLLSDDPSAIAPDYVVELGDKHLVIEHYLSLDPDAQDEVARFIEYQLSKQKTSGSSEADK